MRWRYVMAVGIMMAIGLLAAGFSAMPPYQDAPSPAGPWYLLWAGCGMVGLACAAAFLAYEIETRPRHPAAVARSVVWVVCAIALLGLGEAAVYVAKHPPSQLCRQAPSGHTVCYHQPDRATANDHAVRLFFGGTGLVALTGVAALIGINRRERRGSSPLQLAE